MTGTLCGLRRYAVLVTVLLGILPGAAAAQNGTMESEREALRERVEELANLAVRTQSHVMVDVEYHFTNLWFAAQAQQWDLASFYLRETDSHLRWTVRIRPVRSVRGGGTIDLQPLLQGIEESGFARLESAIESRDAGAFDAAYRQTLSECYACHRTAGLVYLEPHVPERPLSPLMLRSE